MAILIDANTKLLTQGFTRRPARAARSISGCPCLIRSPKRGRRRVPMHP